jgi:thiol:disulfide interchange protein DsbC
MLQRSWTHGLVSTFLAASCVFAMGAAGVVQAAEPTPAKLNESLRKAFGQDVEVKAVNKTPVPGLYEVNVGAQIIYSDASGRYLFNGELLDVQTGTNLTEERLSDLNRIKWSDLPLKQAVKWVKGDGSRHIAVFSDPNCGYCKRLEQTFQEMDNLTVHTFLFPILSPDSTLKSRQVWCASDRTKVWRDLMVNRITPTGASNCSTPIDRNLALGKKLGVNGTPAIFFTDGSRFPGAADAATLERKFATLKK